VVGVVRSAAEKGYTGGAGLEFATLPENSSHISVVQAKSVNDETFVVGDKVRVIDSAGVVRVTH